MTRFTSDMLITVRRPDSKTPDYWVHRETKVPCPSLDDDRADRFEALLRKENAAAIATASLDLVEQGFVVIGPHQHREHRTGDWFGSFLLIEDRVRVVPGNQLDYVKRHWDGRSFDRPFEDAPGWEDVGQAG